MSQEYVGIGLHRRRSVIYRMDEAGEKIDSVRVDNDPGHFAKEVGVAPVGSDVISEATYGWYGAVDLLKQMGYRVHLANPHGNDWGHRRVKNDERDARDLADLLRLGRLAEAWIAPPKIRELREMVRFRLKLSNLRTGLKAQVHAVMAKNGILPCRNDMWGPSGSAQLDSLELPAAYFNRIAVLRDLVEIYDREIGFLDRDIHRQLCDDAGYNAVQAIYGVGPVLAAVFVAEIGDVTRFDSPKALCSGAGLAPSTGSPTPTSTGARSPSRDHGWCAGRQSRRSPATTAARPSGTRSRPSLSAAARPRPTSRSPAEFSRSSTTACATERSAVSPTKRQRDARHPTGCVLAYRHGSRPLGWRSRLRD
jgi:transposase